MDIASKYCKFFMSDNMTRLKYDELYRLAVSINEEKNRISELVCKDLFKYLNTKPFDFVTEMHARFKGVISSNFDTQMYRQVIDMYENKFKALQKKLTFECVEYKGIEVYKRNCKGHKKGEFKKAVIVHRTTPLSSCMTYLARYGTDNILEYINSQLERTDLKQSQADFYKNIIEKCDKFGFDRLFKLALSKRERILKKYAEKPIVFRSLSFGGRSRKKYIVSYNKNYQSVINAFISLSMPNRKTFDIPVKFSKDYHGPMSDYKKSSNDYEYVLCFDERHKQVRINIVKDGTRYIPEVTENDEVVGIDVNIKHNLFSLSNGKTYDYDRKLVADYCELKRHTDTLPVVGKRYQRKLDTLRNKIHKSNQQLISNVCRDLQKQGVRHIAMEDLDNGFGKSFVKEKNLNDINFNDVVHFLGISSLKQEFEHIARNYDIAVSTVHACYTSKMCPICGCIEDENRPNQETFECVECGHKHNADINASINIRNRVSVAVLRNKLLKQLDNGAYKPIPMSRDKVKDALLSYRSSELQGLPKI
jgi:putative transposase